MQLATVLLWLPIVLAVGVAGRLLGRARGMGVGVICALFWMAVIQSVLGIAVWHEGWTVATMISGSLAIVLIGGWSALHGGNQSGDRLTAGQAGNSIETAQNGLNRIAVFSSSLQRFEDWLAEHRDSSDPWPAFGEFLRGALYELCRATHVQPFQVRQEREELVPLHQSDIFDDKNLRSARKGIVGHVATSGRPFVADDASQGELVLSLARREPVGIDWCFPISQGLRRLGVVVVGRLPGAVRLNGEWLRATERLINLYWRMLCESNLGQSAASRDSVTGLMNRPAFLRAAEFTLRESLGMGEPCVLVVVALEGMRELSDSGRWERADEAAGLAARSLRQKLRADDLLGRFDDSRFVLLLRRVDSELAQLIVRQLMERLTSLLSDQPDWAATLRMRFGVVGSGMAQPDLTSLVSQALTLARQAREQGISIATDLFPLKGIGQPNPRPHPRNGDDDSRGPVPDGANPCGPAGRLANTQDAESAANAHDGKKLSVGL